MSVDAVIIGRNEGDRLVKALASAISQARRVVYVDSGSSDDSVANAESVGAHVVNLDMSVPFTAARARNEGFNALAEHDDPPEFVQFLDGDCSLSDGWLDKAEEAMRQNGDLGLVTGLQRELKRDTTVFNQMSDHEWNRPAGEIDACGGNMVVRAAAFNAVGGYDPTVIAAEDDEFCTRLRKAGWKLIRIAENMSMHDGGVLEFSQWWKRAERTGHGFAQVGYLHPEYFVRERLRAWVYGLILPAIFCIGLFWAPRLCYIVLAIFGFSYFKTVRGLVAEGLPGSEARHHAMFLSLSKFPNVLGMLRFHWRRFNNAQMRIIEYK